MLLEYLAYILLGFVACVYVMGTLFAFTITLLSRSSSLELWLFVFGWPIIIIYDEIVWRKKMKDLDKRSSKK